MEWFKKVKDAVKYWWEEWDPQARDMHDEWVRNRGCNFSRFPQGLVGIPDKGHFLPIYYRSAVRAATNMLLKLLQICRRPLSLSPFFLDSRWWKKRREEKKKREEVATVAAAAATTATTTAAASDNGSKPIDNPSTCYQHAPSISNQDEQSIKYSSVVCTAC
ncbi:hypothetical protein SLEP1_g42491 [Rubroshorea leprosula]|uniref:Uncharacterized protein n=1 Tax=Rubroshorea leprosula TaxID=152421 RepID=A0AAV5LA27_9ROSI|nr:hypothetical protein SLEP1_g42491 [Rubroshorea leprosula]